MVKALILAALLLGTSYSIGQLDQVQFTESLFSNGMKYPQLNIKDKAIQDSINNDIKARISDLEESDFCIGQYGYVQKRTHLQIHVFCNCIEFERPENRYLFYNLIDGNAVPYSDIIEPKKASKLNDFILTRIKEQRPELALTAEIENDIQSNGIDAFQTVMQRDGIDIWLPQLDRWGDTPMFLSWVELTPFLSYQFM